MITEREKLILNKYFDGFITDDGINFATPTEFGFNKQSMCFNAIRVFIKQHPAMAHLIKKIYVKTYEGNIEGRCNHYLITNKKITYISKEVYEKVLKRYI